MIICKIKVGLLFFAVCRGHLKYLNKANCTGNFIPYDNGTCYTVDNGTFYGIYNRSLAKENGIKETLPAEDFLL